MNEPQWLSRDSVCEIHTEVIATFGGFHGVRDGGLLDSALSRPQNVFAYEDGTIFDLAASYAEAIAQNHAFIDGNKRTAMTTADVFLQINGYEMNADQQQLADLIVDVAKKKISRDEVSAFFEKNCERILN